MPNVIPHLPALNDRMLPLEFNHMINSELSADGPSASARRPMRSVAAASRRLRLMADLPFFHRKRNQMRAVGKMGNSHRSRSTMEAS